jgi:anti-anti-sigma factor
MARAAKILVTEEEGASLLTFAGEYDVLSSRSLRDRIEQELHRGVPCVLDLRGVTFIDSTIIGALLAAQRLSEDEAVRLAIVLPADAGSSVRRVFEVTHLLPLFRVYDDPDLAVDALVNAS